MELNVDVEKWDSDPAYHRPPCRQSDLKHYFQRIMSTVVLVRLIYKICEIYLDDVIVYAKSIEELIANLTQVFEKFRKHGITLNPEKCRFGMIKTEYVGRVINAEGWKFSDEKQGS
jgi:hypothetical protein